tara:strand:+ start:184 stop:474 length:291 start_codon:yes stop_codon:yes gene_type:complete
MSSPVNDLEELEKKISDKIYIKVSKWNLYLGEAGLSMQLAIECLSNLKQLGPSQTAKQSLNRVFVELGEGKTKLPLGELITSSQVFDLEDILESFC